MNKNPNNFKECWCHCCMEWHEVKDQLWIPDDKGEIDIICIKQYPEKYIHLGYERDL